MKACIQEMVEKNTPQRKMLLDAKDYTGGNDFITFDTNIYWKLKRFI